MSEVAQTVQATPPVLPRDPADLPPELPRGADLPDDHDPLANGILMAHQIEWIEDKSDLKLGEKGRRCGLTYAEALDDTITAATSREAGGDNVFYIGDTKDKGREFIGYVAHFARIVQGELADIEEFMFEDELPDGTSKFISAYRVRFASGFRVEALSSNPANIRGLQGKVVIDEAAFHRDVREVLDAVNALLIWKSKICIISTHNGVLNPFNELIREAKTDAAKGKRTWSLHHIPFAKSVANGLYRRVCLIKGIEWTPDGEAEWEATIRGSYGSRTAKMRQELDAVPAESEGAALSRVQIEACMAAQAGSIVRWSRDDDFVNVDEAERKAVAAEFCEDELDPILAGLDRRLAHVVGEDFARSGDLTSIVVMAIERDLSRRVVMVVEISNVPFDQQRDIFFHICDRLPKFSGAALDARGNGQYLAEKTSQRYGETAVPVMLSQTWYRENAVPYVEAFTDRTVLWPTDADILRDHQGLANVDGIIKVPDDHRTKGEDGINRHGDTAIAGMLAFYASNQDLPEYGFISVREGSIVDASLPLQTRTGRALW